MEPDFQKLQVTSLACGVRRAMTCWGTFWEKKAAPAMPILGPSSIISSSVAWMMYGLPGARGFLRTSVRSSLCARCANCGNRRHESPPVAKLISNGTMSTLEHSCGRLVPAPRAIFPEGSRTQSVETVGGEIAIGLIVRRKVPLAPPVRLVVEAFQDRSPGGKSRIQVRRWGCPEAPLCIGQEHSVLMSIEPRQQSSPRWRAGIRDVKEVVEADGLL